MGHAMTATPSWSRLTLDALVEVALGGGTPSRAKPEYWNGNIPWTRSAHIDQSGGVAVADWITEVGLSESSSNVAPKGSVLVGTRVGVGKVAVAPHDIAISQDLTALVPRQERVTSDFLAFALTAPEVRAQFRGATRGSTIQGVPRKDLLAFTIPTPSLKEQRTIAHVLRTVRLAREKTERVVAASRELKKSLMQHLFTGLSGSARSIDTEFGTIPAHWTVTPLSDCAEIQTGVAKGRHIPNGDQMEVPYLRVANVQDGYLDLGEIKTIAIRSNELSRFSLRAGDILLTEGGDFDKLGRGHIWSGQIEPCVHQNHIFAVRPNPDLLTARYASYLIQSSYARAYFLKVAHRTTNLASINKTKLGAFPMLIPPLDEQLEIERQLVAADQKIAADEARADALTELFDSLLHALMTARLRVADLTMGVA